jgi:hypothetical protein
MRTMPQGRIAALVAALVISLASAASAESPQRAFARRWEGRTVTVKQTLYTLVYNERGKLGNTRNNRRDGLIVVTPSNGVYCQFDGRQGRDDVKQRQALGMLEAVNAAYEPDSLDVRSYRKVEPVVLNRYDAGVELTVARVEIERDFVRVAFNKDVSAGADPTTWLTIKWPVPLSKAFSEGDIVEALLREFVDPVIVSSGR